MFFILVQWLCSLVKTTSKVPEVTLAYDNMCNLDRMKVAQQPLPFPSPFDKLWLNVKIIDAFHFCNHTSEKCHTKYNPAKIKADNPHFNTHSSRRTNFCVGSQIQTYSVLYEQDTSPLLPTPYGGAEKLVYKQVL